VASFAERARKRLGGVALDVTLRSLSGAGKLHPRARPHRHGVEVVRDVPYGERPFYEPHLLDVYRPLDRAGLRPTVLYLHGGGFRILSKDTHWMMGLAFARRGYVVFNANYRLAPAHPFPAAIQDATRVLRWVADHAIEYGGDPSRVVLAGESAGANLVTALTVACCFEREEPWARSLFERQIVPCATIPLCGILEVSNAHRFFEARELPAWVCDRIVEVCDGYLGRPPHPGGSHLDLANPLRVLESGDPPKRPLPPFHASVGVDDPIADDTRRLEVALRRRGVPHHVTYHRGEGHAFQAMIFRSEARRAWRELYSFLERHGPSE
jgi:acetyl esterase